MNLLATDANCVYTYEFVAHTQKVCRDMFKCIEDTHLLHEHTHLLHEDTHLLHEHTHLLHEHTHLPSQHKTEEAGRIDMFTSCYHTYMP